MARYSGGGHGSPLQHPCRENPMDRGACWAVVYKVAASQTLLKQLSTHRWSGITNSMTVFKSTELKRKKKLSLFKSKYDFSCL